MKNSFPKYDLCQLVIHKDELISEFCADFSLDLIEDFAAHEYCIRLPIDWRDRSSKITKNLINLIYTEHDLDHDFHYFVARVEIPVKQTPTFYSKQTPHFHLLF
jgi:hypothetical protein